MGGVNALCGAVLGMSFFVLRYGGFENGRTSESFKTGITFPVNKLGVIECYVEKCQEAWSPLILSYTPKSKDILISWKKPPEGWVKLNVDGSCLMESGMIGEGGIICNYEGKWHTGFVHNICRGDLLLAEAWAALSGVQTTLTKGFTDVTLESDSQDLIEWLKNNSNYIRPEHPLENILFRTQQMLASLNRFQIIHTFREGNLCADHLTHLAVASPIGVTVLEQPPASLLSLLELDVAGNSISRSTHGLDRTSAEL